MSSNLIKDDEIYISPSWYDEFMYHIIPKLEELNQIFHNNIKTFNSCIMQEIFSFSYTNYSDLAVPQNLMDYCFNDINFKDARTISDEWIKFIEIKKKLYNEEVAFFLETEIETEIETKIETEINSV